MYKVKNEGWLKHWDFLLLDVVCVQLTFYLSSYLLLNLKNVTYFDMYRNQAVILLLCVFMHSYLAEPYKGILRRTNRQEFKCLLRGTFYMMLLNLTFLFFVHIAQLMSRKVFVLTWGLYFVFSLVIRWAWKKVLLHRKGGAIGARSILLVTTADYLESVTAEMTSEPMSGFFISGVFLSGGIPEGYSRTLGAPILGDSSMAASYACSHWVDEVFLKLPAGSPEESELRESFLNMGITVHEYLAEVEARPMDREDLVIESFGRMVVATTALRAINAGELFIKRLMDIVGGLIGSIITLILCIFVGPAIYFSSPGPIFFSQVRIGRNGRPFKMYKFRSMVPGAEEQKDALQDRNISPDGMMFKVEDDPRIIGSGKKDRKGRPKGIGHFIRRTSIDEFPQFFNVLIGNMSLVGTRPPTLDEWEKYQQKHRLRMSVRPGITGMWQVNSRSQAMDFDSIVQMDAEYIRSWNLLLDLKILGKTIAAVFSGNGA